MSTYEVSVRVSFSAAHAIPHGDGRMEKSHVHTWETTATFRSRSIDNEMGVVIDFLAVKTAMDAIASRLGGENLNDLDAFSAVTTSAENVAAHIAGELRRELPDQNLLYRLSVTEAPGCEAAYYPNET